VRIWWRSSDGSESIVRIGRGVSMLDRWHDERLNEKRS
jgi:hypothetical protein